LPWRRQTTEIASESAPNVASGQLVGLPRDLREVEAPGRLQTTNMPSRNPKSPMRLTTKAFFPASDADGLVNQNPMSRYEQRPTPSQPTNITGKLAPSTSTSMKPANRLRYEK
jgi:hypothetical protein